MITLSPAIPLIMDKDKKVSIKEKILITAHNLFYSTGFKATGVDKIIKEAKVTKVTFYRYFPSKSLLIIAYLHYRHEMWMNWFNTTLLSKLDENKAQSDALSETLDVWFSYSFYRGCAFINATAEAESEDIAEKIKEICREHKFETEKRIASLLNITDKKLTGEIVMLMDGAIIHAQMGIEKNEVINQFKAGLDKLLPQYN